MSANQPTRPLTWQQIVWFAILLAVIVFIGYASDSAPPPQIYNVVADGDYY